MSSSNENVNNALIEKDMLDDIALAEDAYREYQKNPRTYTHEEAWKEILD